MDIWFAGDRVRATAQGQQVTGVIEGFDYDVPALFRGEPGDTATVRLSVAAGSLARGDLVQVPVADLEAAAR